MSLSIASLHCYKADKAGFVCWDWDSLLRRPAAKQHYEAFFQLCKSLKPSLENTAWPRNPEFQFVTRQWPQERGPNGWFQQYKTLTLRLKAEAKSIGRRESWWRIVGVQVEPVVEAVSRFWLSLARAPQLQHASPAGRACVLFLIRRFMGDAYVSAAVPFETKPSSLVPPGARRASGQRAQFRASVGSFASLVVPGGSRKLVFVVALHRKVDEAGLVSSLHSEKSLVFPDSSGAHCWHVVRAYLRDRRKSPESICERWGSLMHMLWDSVGGWQPHRIVARLFMRESRFLDRPASRKSIEAEIASFIYHKKGSPYVGARFAREDSSEEGESGDDLLLGVRAKLREDVRSREWWRKKSCPAELLPAAQEAVARAMAHSSRRLALGALPQFKGDKPATPSVKADALSQWLKSDDAVHWRLERTAMFPNAK